MRLLLQTAMVLTLVSGYETVVTPKAKPCSDGWTFYDGNCYFPNEDPETFEHADLTCELSNGKLAYGYDNKSIQFLTQFIGDYTTYGWWYGVQVYYSYNGDMVVKLKNQYGYYGDQHSISRENSIPLPKAEDVSAPSSGCIAYTQLFDQPLNVMTKVPCTVTLPYICRSDTGEIKDPGHYVRNSSKDVYYFSSPYDKLSFQDASKSCSEKHMTLASIRDSDQKTFVDVQIKGRSLNNIDPWWIGLDIKNGLWSDGVEMQDGIVQWKSPIMTRIMSIKRQCRILLSDGTLSPSTCYTSKAPFICVRPSQIIEENFGCPTGWHRGGQSCYYTSKDYVNAVDANRMCLKHNSHFISIDGQLEKTWIQSIFKYNTLWVSLNDKASTGHFVWADGSGRKPSVVSWYPGMSTGPEMCGVFTPWSNALSTVSCAISQYSGCQYVSTSDSCVSNNWFYLNGNCYYLPKMTGYRAYSTPYKLMLHICYTDLEKYDNTAEVYPLKLDSKELVEKYRSIMIYRVWTGMKVKPTGTMEWADGTPVDKTLFSNVEEPNPGTPDDPFHCVQITADGYLTTASCEKGKAKFICEKKIPYHPNNPNDGADVSPSGIVMMIVLCTSSVLITKTII